MSDGEGGAGEGGGVGKCSVPTKDEPRIPQAAPEIPLAAPEFLVVRQRVRRLVSGPSDRNVKKIEFYF